MKIASKTLMAMCAITPTVAMAAEPATTPTLMPVVTVTATRTPKLADETLASVIVIDREALESSSGLDLGEVIRFHSGIDIVRSGGAGQQTSIFMRGANSNQTLVLIDGVRVNSGTYGGVNIQNLRPENVDRVEIVKGPRSSLYGSDAIGGVINIITKPSERTATHIELGGGDNNTAYGTFRQSIRMGKLSASVNAGGIYTDGYPIFLESDEPRGHTNKESGVDVGYAAESFSVRARYQNNSGTTEYLSFGMPIDQEFTNDLGLLEATYKASEVISATLRLSNVRDEIDQNQSDDFAHTDRREADLKFDMALPGNQLLTVGGTYTDSDVSALIYGSGYASVVNNHAVYVQDQLQHGAFSLLVAGRHENHEAYGEHTTGELSVGYALNANNRIRASASTGYRTPDGNQLFGFGGDPALEPEEAENMEIGSLHTVGSWQLGTAVFRNEVKNLIDFNPMTYMLQNINNSRLEGVELSINWQTANWSWKNQAGYTKAIDRDTEEELSRRPRQSFSSQLEFKQERYSVGGTLLAKSHSDNSAFDDIRLPGHAVLNLHASVKLDQNVKVRLNVENVADKEYGLSANGTDGIYVAQPLTMSASLVLDF